MDCSPRYLDIAKAAAYTSLSESFLRKLTARAQIPHLRVGRRTLYDRVLLDRWLQRRIQPASWRA